MPGNESKCHYIEDFNGFDIDKRLLENLTIIGCYYSFGLVGLLTLISNFISQIETSKTLVVHTIQSIVIGIFVSLITLLIAVMEPFTIMFDINAEILATLISLWPFLVFIVISAFAIKVVLIKKVVFRTTCIIIRFLT